MRPRCNIEGVNSLKFETRNYTHLFFMYSIGSISRRGSTAKIFYIYIHIKGIILAEMGTTPET